MRRSVFGAALAERRSGLSGPSPLTWVDATRGRPGTGSVPLLLIIGDTRSRNRVQTPSPLSSGAGIDRTWRYPLVSTGARRGGLGSSPSATVVPGASDASTTLVLAGERDVAD